MGKRRFRTSTDVPCTSSNVLQHWCYHITITQALTSTDAGLPIHKMNRLGILLISNEYGWWETDKLPSCLPTQTVNRFTIPTLVCQLTAYYKMSSQPETATCSHTIAPINLKSDLRDADGHSQHSSGGCNTNILYAYSVRFLYYFLLRKWACRYSHPTQCGYACTGKHDSRLGSVTLSSQTPGVHLNLGTFCS